MSAKGYTTEAVIENYLLQNIDSSFSSQIDKWIESVEQIIDKMTGRNFIADSEATARLFDGDGTQELLIDECIEITKVEVGNDDYGSSFTEVAATGADRYFKDPPNYEVKGLPVYKLTLRSREWIDGKQNHRVTAKWGFSASVPKDIEFAATVFVAGIINQEHLQGNSEVKSESIGNYSVTYNTDNGGNSWADFQKAMEILNNYKVLYI